MKEIKTENRENGKERKRLAPKQKFWLRPCLLQKLWCYATLVCLYCSNCTKFGQLIIWKIIKFIAKVYILKA